jgi:hypothetical protein
VEPCMCAACGADSVGSTVLPVQPMTTTPSRGISCLYIVTAAREGGTCGDLRDDEGHGRGGSMRGAGELPHSAAAARQAQHSTAQHSMAQHGRGNHRTALCSTSQHSLQCDEGHFTTVPLQGSSKPRVSAYWLARCQLSGGSVRQLHADIVQRRAWRCAAAQCRCSCPHVHVQL